MLFSARLVLFEFLLLVLPVGFDLLYLSLPDFLRGSLVLNNSLSIAFSLNCASTLRQAKLVV